MASAPMHDPDTHCVKCDHEYSIFDESCQHCGFNPCDGGEDEELEKEARIAWAYRGTIDG